jgi:hypothetical protein
VFTARYGLIPYIKQIIFSLLKVNQQPTAHNEYIWDKTLCFILLQVLTLQGCHGGKQQQDKHLDTKTFFKKDYSSHFVI